MVEEALEMLLQIAGPRECVREEEEEEEEEENSIETILPTV